MKIFKSTTLIATLFLVFSCSEKQVSTKNSLRTIPEIVEKKNILISDLGESLEIVKLQNEWLLGQLDQLLFDDENIYILDRDYSASICKYDFKGNLQGRLLIEQDQKFDLNGISDMFFYSGHIVVNDAAKGNQIALNKKLEIVDYALGNAKANIIYPFSGKWLLFNNYLDRAVGYDLLVYDRKSKEVEKKYIPFNKKDYGYSYKAQNTFKRLDEKIYFSKAFNDTIYEINEKFDVSPYLAIDFRGKKVPEGYLSSGVNTMDIYHDMKNGVYSFLEGNVHFGKENSLLVKYLKEGKVQNLFVPENEHKAYSAARFVDDLISGIEFIEVKQSNEDYLVFAISAENLLSQGNVYPGFIEEYDISADDNFLLFFLKK